MSKRRTRKRGVRVPKTGGAYGNPKIFRTETWKKPKVELEEVDEKKGFISRVRGWFKRKSRKNYVGGTF